MIITEVAGKMRKPLEILENQLRGVCGRGITAGLVETVRLSYYGQPTQLGYVAQLAQGDGRVLVTPHDPTLIPAATAALKGAGFNAYQLSKTAIAVSANALRGDDYERAKSQVRKLGEEAKVSVRGVRKKCRQEMDAGTPKDERKKLEAAIDEAAAQAVVAVERLVAGKLKDMN